MYPQSMFWSKNKKKVYPCKPQFYYIKVGCKGVFVTRTRLRDGKALKEKDYIFAHVIKRSTKDILTF